MPAAPATQIISHEGIGPCDFRPVFTEVRAIVFREPQTDRVFGNIDFSSLALSVSTSPSLHTCNSIIGFDTDSMDSFSHSACAEGNPNYSAAVTPQNDTLLWQTGADVSVTAYAVDEFGTQRPTFFYPNPAALTPSIPHPYQGSVPIAAPALHGRTIGVALGLPLAAHEPCTTPLPQPRSTVLIGMWISH